MAPPSGSFPAALLLLQVNLEEGSSSSNNGRFYRAVIMYRGGFGGHSSVGYVCHGSQSSASAGSRLDTLLY
jgi:hypothetical protein